MKENSKLGLKANEKGWPTNLIKSKVQRVNQEAHEELSRNITKITFTKANTCVNNLGAISEKIWKPTSLKKSNN